MRKVLFALLCACVSLARAAPAEFAIEAEIAPSAVYVGAEAVLRLRLLRAPGVAYGTLRAPALGDAAEIRPLERVRWSEARHAGVTWQVHEVTYLIVPRRAGRIAVPDVELDGPLRHALVSAGYRGATSGPKLVLEVRAPPPEAGEPWLPARHLTLEESWSPDPALLAAGAPVTRSLTLRAEGIPAQRLPTLEMAGHPALRVHHDQPELATEYHAAGAIGRLVQRIALVPLDEGEIVLPELSVRWWDVVAHAPRVATLAGRTLRLQVPLPPPPVQPAPSDVSPVSFWRAVAAAFALVLVAWLWWHARTQALREARRQVRKACRKNEAAAARDALIQWWMATSSGTPAPLVQQIGAAWDPAARAQLGALDAALYGRRAWDGREFWRCVRPWLRKTTSRRAAARAPLRPFFRLQATHAGSSRRD